MTYTPPTPQEMAEKIKDEIRNLIARNIIPATVSSFSQLHDHIDANCLGDAEQIDNMMHAIAADDGHQAVTDAMATLCNAAQNIVNEWLAAGGHRPKPLVVIGQGSSQTTTEVGDVKPYIEPAAATLTGIDRERRKRHDEMAEAIRDVRPQLGHPSMPMWIEMRKIMLLYLIKNDMPVNLFRLNQITDEQTRHEPKF